ncbi:MAG: hypothetical protein ABFR33_06435 [Verrucomicrobiota bacterium]
MMVVAGLGLGGVLNVARAENSAGLAAEADKAVAAAASAVEEARAAIKNGKQFVAMIPADSPLMGEVAEILKAAKENWILAVSALEGAKESASKISSASSPEIAQDYKLLATVNAGVALSGAKVVQTGILFVDAAANNKSESLDIIRTAMQDSLAAAAQVQFNYDRVKGLIAEKYSK